MKIRTCAFAFLMLFAFAFSAQAKVNMPTRYMEALMTNSTETLNTILAANYIHISANGHIQDKEHFLKNLKKGLLRVDRIRFFNERMTAYGSTEVVTGNAELKAAYNAKGALSSADGLVRFTMVLDRSNRDNKIVLFQLTPVIPSAACSDGNCEIR